MELCRGVDFHLEIFLLHLTSTAAILLISSFSQSGLSQMFVLVFPQAFCISFLAEWFELKDVRKLDTAACNTNSRPKMLEFLQHEYLLSVMACERGFEWIARRNMKPRKLLVEFGEENITWNLVNLSFVNETVFTRRPIMRTQASLIVNECSQLKYIALPALRDVDAFIASINSAVLSQLETINIYSDCTDESTVKREATLNILSDNTNSIVNLQIRIYLNEISDETLSKFLTRAT